MRKDRIDEIVVCVEYVVKWCWKWMFCVGRVRAERSCRRRSAEYGNWFGDVPSVINPCDCNVRLEEI